MVDRQSRDQLARALRQLASGAITIDEYENLSNLDSEDAAVSELRVLGWLCYSDLWDGHTRLRGRRALSKNCRREIAKAVVFLKSDQVYMHRNALREQTVLGRLFVTCLCIGLAGSLVIAVTVSWWLLMLIPLVFPTVWLLMYTVALIHYLLFPRLQQPEEPGGAIWPFASKELLDEAVGRPPFLCGRVAGREGTSRELPHSGQARSLN